MTSHEIQQLRMQRLRVMQRAASRHRGFGRKLRRRAQRRAGAYGGRRS